MGTADTTLPKGKSAGSIRNRLLLLLLIVLLPILIMEGVVFYHRYETRLNEEFQSNLEIARAFGKTFENFYQNLIRAELIVGLALTDDPSHTLQDQNWILDAFQADYPSIRSFFWIDKQGIIVASSIRSYIGFDISDRSYYKEVMAGRDWHVSELIVGKASGKPAFTISRGIRNQKGELLGIVAASIEPDSLDTALSLYRSSDAGVSLIDHKGMNVYRYPDLDYTWEQRNWLKHYPVMEESFRGKEVTSRVASDYSGKNRLIAFVPISGIGWVAAASRGEDDVVSDILSTLLFQSGLILIIALTGFGSAVLFSRPLAKSITRLRDHAVALGRGEKTTIEEPEGPVEVRELYGAFQTMDGEIQRREVELRSEISKHKQTELELRQSEERYRGVVQNTTAIILRIDPQGIIRFANERALQFFGYSAEELIGKHAIGTIVPERESTGRDLAAMVNGIAENPDRYHSNANENIRKNGERVWIEWTNSSIYDTDGKLKEFLSVGIDATERKQAEDKLKANEKKLSEIYASMTEGLALHEIVSDHSGKAIDYMITDVNPAFEKITMLNRDHVIGKRASAAYGTGEAPYLDTYAEVASTGKPVTFEVHFSPMNKYFSISVFSPDKGKFATIFQDITNRKLAEESVERLKALMDHNPSLAFLKDESGRYVYLNSAYEKQFALSKDWYGKTDFDFWPKESAELFRANDYEILQSGQVKQYLEDSMDLNGTRYCWLAYKFSFADSNNKRYVGGIGINVTDRVRAEEALREAKDKLEQRVRERTAELHASSLYTRSLIEASLDPLVTISNDGKITDVSRASEEVTGVSREQLIGSDFSDYFTDPEKARAGYEEVFRQGFVRDYPLELKHRDGHTTPVLYNASVYRDDSGQIKGVFAAARDITEIRKAEEATRTERKRFFDVLETLPVYVILLTPDYHVPFANRFFRERFGESQGKRCYEYLFNRTEPCEICETYTVFKTGKPHHWEWTGPDGRNYDIYDFPFADTDGTSLIMEMGIDITEVKLAQDALRIANEMLEQRVVERTAKLAESEERLRLANDHLEQRVRERTLDLQNLTDELENSRDSLRQLASELVLAEERERKRVATVLHDEIAQTLAVARMRIDMLNRLATDDESRQTLKDAKDFLVQSIKETRALMNDLGNPLLFDLGVAAACESLADRLMASHPIQIRCDIGESFKNLDPEVKVILFQVVRELLNNVIKHSGARNAEVLIHMDDGQIYATVKDDGMGFDPQTLGAPTAEGGFGLFSIRERLMAFNGAVSIESTPETGTMITASLPARLERTLGD